ncbi:MAG: FeoA family protein [Chloracidobacterium sp.]
MSALRPTSAAAANDRSLTLADVAAGERVRVCRVADMDGADILRERGLCEASEVRVITAGDPLVCAVLGARMTLNRHTARGVLVERLP